MKQPSRNPPKPTREESERLKNFIWMEDRQFESVFKPKCTELSSLPIRWKISLRRHVAVKAQVYGLRAFRLHDRQPCIVNYFIRYHRRLYQAFTMPEACDLISLLKKEAAYDAFEKQVYAEKYNVRKN